MYNKQQLSTLTHIFTCSLILYKMLMWFTVGIDTEIYLVTVSNWRISLFLYAEMAEEVLHPVRARLASLCSGRNGEWKLSLLWLITSKCDEFQNKGWKMAWYIKHWLVLLWSIKANNWWLWWLHGKFSITYCSFTLPYLAHWFDIVTPYSPLTLLLLLSFFCNSFHPLNSWWFPCAFLSLCTIPIHEREVIIPL